MRGRGWYNEDEKTKRGNAMENTFRIDHDLHIHTQLSSCSSDPGQTAERILAYAKQNGFRQVCVTDHFWDEKVPGASSWYEPQNFEHIKQALPLPQTDGVRFYFGCETEMDKYFRIGIARETLDRFDFIIVPTTHLHMKRFTIEEFDASLQRRAVLYVHRFERVLSSDLPFHKVGIAHLTTGLIARANHRDHLDVLGMIPDTVFVDLFKETAKRGMGVELNFNLMKYPEEEREEVLRPYRIALDCGCRFYLGSDAHHPAELDAAPARFTAIVDALGLTEDVRFDPFKG